MKSESWMALTLFSSSPTLSPQFPASVTLIPVVSDLRAVLIRLWVILTLLMTRRNEQRGNSLTQVIWLVNCHSALQRLGVRGQRARWGIYTYRVCGLKRLNVFMHFCQFRTLYLLTGCLGETFGSTLPQVKIKVMIFPLFRSICKWSLEHMVEEGVHNGTTHTAPLSPHPQTHSHKTWPPVLILSTSALFHMWCDIRHPVSSQQLAAHGGGGGFLLVRQQVCSNSANIVPNPFRGSQLPWRLAQWSIHSTPSPASNSLLRTDAPHK